MKVKLIKVNVSNHFQRVYTYNQLQLHPNPKHIPKYNLPPDVHVIVHPQVHSLSTMLQHIIINDVTRFLFIYAFVLTGFGFAIHSLLHLSADVAERFPTAWHSLFFTFNLMVGMADHDFDQEFDTAYHNSGSRSIWVTRRWLYLLEIVGRVHINFVI